MSKRIILSLIMVCLSAMSLFSDELYGFIESYEVDGEYGNHYIFLNQNKEIRDRNDNLISEIEKLTRTNMYGAAVLNTLLTAGEKGWCTRFTVASLLDGAVIQKVKTPYKEFSTPINGLIAEYLFENNAQDTSGNQNHGAARNGVAYQPGITKQAASFDGIDDFIEITSQSDVSAIGDFTISV